MLTLLPTLWWLLFSMALGLCIGSFTNVLIHRLPQDRSPREPRWSACPHCKTRIRWSDNVPVFSFLRLRGRCRNCHLPISVRYPVVELLMAITFVAITDAFLLSEGRPGLRPDAFGGADRFLSDWPMVLAHLLLFAALFVMSAIDIEHYWVDIRFSTMAIVSGFVLHTIWTPRDSLTAWPRPDSVAASVSLAVLAGLGIVWLVSRLAPDDDEEWDEGNFADPAAEAPSGTETPATGAPQAYVSPYEKRSASSRWPVWFVLAALIVMVIAIIGESAGGWPTTWLWRSGICVGAMLAVIIGVGCAARASDEQIETALEEERFSARRMVLGETVLLLPAAIFALLVGGYLMTRGEVRAAAEALLHHVVGAGESSRSQGGWQPLLGFSTAAMGFVIGGALGWFVRITFTLVFGKEAFGTGDIHMMAAAGCVAGWPVVVIGFFLACLMAMAGWLVTLPFKRTRAIPLGPWLSLGFLTVVLFYRPLMESAWIRNVADAVIYLSTPTQPRERKAFEFVLPPEGHDFLRLPSK